LGLRHDGYKDLGSCRYSCRWSSAMAAAAEACGLLAGIPSTGTEDVPCVSAEQFGTLSKRRWAKTGGFGAHQTGGGNPAQRAGKTAISGESTEQPGQALLMGQEQGVLQQAPGMCAALARLNGLEWLQANEMPRLCRTAPMVEQVP